MTRQSYLTQHWNPYPAMPDQVLAAGRIRKIDFFDHSVQIQLEREGAVHSFLVPVSKVAACLVSGDLVAILPDQTLFLLAPFLTSEIMPPFPYETQRQWQQFLSKVRSFFEERNFLEVKTPSLVVCPGTEPSLDVFSTELKIGSFRQKLYLPTSPELHLKKALAKGAEKIFEVATCFRNGEKTSKHLPEFTLLEWYRAYQNLSSVQKDVVQLIEHAAKGLQVAGPRSVRFFSVAELFKTYCDFELQPQTTLEDLKDLAATLKVDVRSAESIDDYFFLIFTEKIEELLPPEDLIFVEKYPPYQAALARLTPDGWGDRFEAYWKGFELANAFHELNDPQVQRLRSQEDLKKKKDLGKEDIPLDEDFFRHLEAGMPPSAGVALGLERLFMCLFDLQDISKTKWHLSRS